jgi:hypothetical protein
VNPERKYWITASAGRKINGDDGQTTPTPEPATMILLGSGLIGLAWFGRKKFSKK